MKTYMDLAQNPFLSVLPACASYCTYTLFQPIADRSAWLSLSSAPESPRPSIRSLSSAVGDGEPRDPGAPSNASNERWGHRRSLLCVTSQRSAPPAPSAAARCGHQLRATDPRSCTLSLHLNRPQAIKPPPRDINIHQVAEAPWGLFRHLASPFSPSTSPASESS